MNTQNKQGYDIDVAYEIALCAVSKGIDEAQKLADRLNLVIEKERLLADIELFFGAEIAAEKRLLLDDDSIEEFCLNLSQLKEEMDAELRQAHAKFEAEAEAEANQATLSVATTQIDALKKMLSRLGSHIDTIQFTSPVQKLMISLTPMQWSYGSDLRSKGGSDGNAADSSNPTSTPKIDPSLDIEEDSLTIWLRLRTQGLALPETREAISLFVDGAHYPDFVFHRSGDDTISIEVKVDSNSLATLSEKEFNLYYTSDLREISIVVGANPNEL